VTGHAKVSVPRRYPDFRRLWMARAISYIGDGIALVALVLYVKRELDSGFAVGALLLAHTLPRLLGPFTGALVDRVERRSLMVGRDLGQAAVFGLIAVARPPVAPVIVMVAVASLLATLFGPANRSAVPAFVSEEQDLTSANAWMGTALNLQLVVGPLAGGLLADWLGLQGALGANAMTFLGSAALLLRLPTLHPWDEGHGRDRFLAETRAGLSFVRRHLTARAVIVTLFLGVAFAALDNVALVFLIRDVLDASAVSFGVVTSSYGIGMVLAAVVLVRARGRHSAVRYFLAGWLLSGIGTLLTGLAPAVGVTIAMQALAGTGNGAENVAGDTLLQKTVPQNMLGRVFGLSATAAALGGTTASAVGGVLVELTSARMVFVIAGSGTLAVFLLAIAMLRKAG
jgi:MFS family permease